MRDVTTHSPELGNRTQKGKRSNLLSLFACGFLASRCIGVRVAITDAYNTTMETNARCD